MESCVALRRDMLVNPIDLQVEDDSMDFKKAKEIADRKACEISENAMLIAWFDRKTGRFSPQIECGGKEKPSWLVYAESRGANITIDVNHESYVFVYLGTDMILK